MFKNLLILLIAVFCYSLLDAQNVMDPNDPIVTYSSAAQAGTPTHPNQPPFGVMSKWVRTVRMGWNTSAYKCYIWNGLAFRLRFPNNYNPANATKYPIVVFFHGGGEIGPITDNEFHLLWGGQLFEQRVNNNEWNGFILYAQSQTVGFDDSYFSRINSVLDTLQKYNNLDPDRAIAMGLSEGAYGSVAWANAYPKRVAAALVASPTQVRTLDGSLNNWKHIPIWFANGGVDVNPDVYNAQAIYTDIRNAGGNVYQTFYVNDAHGTWNDMWNLKNASGGFVTDMYWNTVHKAQPLVYFQNQQFCNGAPISARMGVTAGFFAYQWSLNGSTIASATGNEYTATQAGTYAVRFMRTATSGWSNWTPNPVVISTKACTADTVFSENFSQDNYYNASAQYKLGNWGCQNGIMTSGTDVITQDATGVQGSRFLLNYTSSASGCTYAVGDIVWQRYNPGTVTPNTNYEFSFYLANQNATSPAQIAPTINGTPLIPSNGFASVSGVGNASWKKFTYTWNSGSNTQAYVALTNRNTATTGNDFAIDEISLKLAALPLPACTNNTSPANAAVLTTNTTASLTWASAANATSYDVYLWTGSTAPTVPVANVTVTNYSASGLTGSTLYKWYVVPKNISGAPTGCSNNQTTFTTAVTPVPPPCVTNLLPATGSTLITSATATLTWNASATATSYDVYLWTGATAPSTASATVTAATYSATGLTPATLYNWYIVPKNIAGPSTGCNANFTTFTTAQVPPPCVTNLLPATGSSLATSSTATLTWNTTATATSYDVYLWTGATAPSVATATVTNPTYSASGLTPSTLYNWYIVPNNTAGASSGCSTNFTTFSTAAVPPPCVTNLLPSGGSTLATITTATLTWNAAATATSYDVYLWTGATAPTTPTATVTNATYSATGLTASSLYNWYVIPKNSAGPSTGCDANFTSFTTAALPTPPSCVTNLIPRADSVLTTITTATLIWNAAPTATSYDVYLWTGATAPVTPTATVTNTTYSASGLSSSSLYNWYVVPKNDAGSPTGCNANVTAFTTAVLLPPACVTNLLPGNGVVIATSATATLTWNAADGAGSYDVYLWTGATAPSTPTVTVTAATYSASGLTPATLYNWYIVPKNTAGASTSCNANFTSFTTAQVPPACVTNLSPTTGSALGTSSAATLTWNAAPTATSYDVYLWTGATAPVTPTINVTDSTYSASGLTPSTQYSWYIVPKNAAGGSAGCSTNFTTFTTAAVPPACVTNLLPATGSTLTSTTTATLTWNTAATAASYDVYLWTGATAPSSPTTTVTSATYSATGLTPSSLYNWYIVPGNSAGPSSGCSVNFTTFTTAALPTAPSCVTNLLPANGSTLTTSTNATLTWNAAATATSYDVYLWTGATAPVTPTANVTSATYSSTSLIASTLYSWYVVPKNAVGPATGCSANVTSFTTSSNTALGYIKTAVGPYQACDDNSSTGRTTVYGTSVANGTILYTNAAKTQIFNGGWQWYSYTATLGGPTIWAFAVYPTGGIFMLRNCATGVYVRVAGAGGGTTVEEDIATLNRLRDSAAAADAAIAASKPAVYPNPVIKGMPATLHINSTTGGTATVQVAGVAGNIIRTHQLSIAPGANLRTIQTTGLERGIYFLRIGGNTDKPATLKLVIQ